MRRMKAFVVVLGVVGATVATATPAVADDKAKLVERIVAKADPDLLEVLVTTRGKDGKPQFDTVKVTNVAAAKRVVDDMLGRPKVAAVEMNRRVFAAGFSDPYYRYQWPLDSRHFYYGKIWPLTRYDTRRPVIAVVDSGVQIGHADLNNRISGGFNAFTGSTTANDDCGHGTHVAGIIRAGLNNGRGIIGLAQRATVRPVKVLHWSKPTLLEPYTCWGTAESVADGIAWAASRANIISLSLESSGSSDAEQFAIQYAQSLGRVVVAAAGNHGEDDPGVVYPAGYSGVLGVAAVSNRSAAPYWSVASFSNSGYWVDVAAPGVYIPSTVPAGLNRDCPISAEFGGGYCIMSGTSMAAPYVSATLALGMQHCGWSARAAMSRIQRTASGYPTKVSSIGYGVVNPLRMLRC